MVISADLVPWFDERFAGYGMNKCSHLAAVNRMLELRRGESKELTHNFRVLPGHFVVAKEHETSVDFKVIYDCICGFEGV